MRQGPLLSNQDVVIVFLIILAFIVGLSSPLGHELSFLLLSLLLVSTLSAIWKWTSWPTALRWLVIALAVLFWVVIFFRPYDVEKDDSGATTGLSRPASQYADTNSVIVDSPPAAFL
jgi:uncharacterized membrane protein